MTQQKPTFIVFSPFLLLEISIKKRKAAFQTQQQIFRSRIQAAGIKLRTKIRRRAITVRYSSCVARLQDKMRETHCYKISQTLINIEIYRVTIFSACCFYKLQTCSIQNKNHKFCHFYMREPFKYLQLNCARAVNVMITDTNNSFQLIPNVKRQICLHACCSLKFLFMHCTVGMTHLHGSAC